MYTNPKKYDVEGDASDCFQIFEFILVLQILESPSLHHGYLLDTGRDIFNLFYLSFSHIGNSALLPIGFS